MNETANWLYRFLKKRKKIKRDPLTEETDIFETGFVDSLGIVELVTSIESTFSIRLDSAQLQDPKFKTIQGIAEIIDKRRNGQSP